MRRTSKRMIHGTAALMLLLPAVAMAQAGGSGLAYLKLGVSGRGVSMGDAMSAIATGATATYYNPAGVIDSGGSELMFMHKEWIQDVRTEYLGAAFPLWADDALGISLNSTTVSDIEIRTVPGPPDGTFTARDFSFGLSYARRLSDRLRAGITAKFLYEKILVNEASGYAFDAGVQYATPIEHLTAGAVLANIGGMGALESEKIKLPALARFGPAYTLPISGGEEALTLAADGMYIFPEKKFYLNTGGEFSFLGIAAARVGYQFGSAARGFSAGVGFSHGIIALDYAYASLASDLGSAHTVSIALKF